MAIILFIIYCGIEPQRPILYCYGTKLSVSLIFDFVIQVCLRLNDIKQSSSSHGADHKYHRISYRM